MELVKCPKCKRTIAHYLEGDNTILRVVCPRCKQIVFIFSAGKTASSETTIKINIEF